jgi:serine protease
MADETDAGFFIETNDVIAGDELRARVAARYPGVELDVALLGPEGPREACTVAAIRFQGVPWRDVPEHPYDMAYGLGDALGLRSVTPVLPYAGGTPPAAADAAQPNDNVPSDPEWHLKAMRVPEAWAYSESLGRPAQGRGVVVAQPDTGVTNHPAIAGAYSLDRGWNFIEKDQAPFDPLYPNPFGIYNPGHGTATCGVVAGRGEAGSKRVRGVAPAAIVAPFRVINSVIIGAWSEWDIARAIYMATERGYPVLSMSFGGLWSIPIHIALGVAAAKGVICVGAAGQYFPWSVAFPGYDYPVCCGVAGSAPSGLPWYHSAYGLIVNHAAPAEYVYVAWRGSQEDAQKRPDFVGGEGAGTSYSAAATAGAAALWLAHHGERQLRERYGFRLGYVFFKLVTGTATRPEDWNTSRYGGGVLNAEALLKASLPSTNVIADAIPLAARNAGAAALRQRIASLATERNASADELDDAFLLQYGPELEALLSCGGVDESSGLPRSIPPSRALTAAARERGLALPMVG